MQNKSANKKSASFVSATLAFVLGVIFSVFGYFTALKMQHDHIQHDFLLSVNARANAIEKALNLFVGQLESVSSLFSIFPSVSRQEFKNFVQPILAKQKGIQAIGWAPYVLASERQSYEEKARKEWLPNFQFIEKDEAGQSIKEKERPYYYPVYYEEPLEGNFAAVGFDLGSNSSRLEAITKAKETKKTTATAKVLLVQEKEKAFGVLLIFPIFAEASEVFKGVVSGVMRIKDVIDKTMGEFFPRAIDIAVYDKTSSDPKDQLMYFYNSESWIKKQPYQTLEEVPQTPLTISQSIKMGDRIWEIVYQATPAFSPYSFQAFFVFAAGIIISFAVAMIIRTFFERAQQEHIRSVLEEQVRERTVQLQESIDQLKSTQKRLVTQEKLASLGGLTAGIAHEIKNPLNFINNFAVLSIRASNNLGTLMDKYINAYSPEDSAKLTHTNTTIKENLERINAQGKKADSIIQRMLVHSTSKSGGAFAPTDIHALLDEYVNLTYLAMRAQDPSFNVRIEKMYDLTLGKLDVVPSDLGRVILNILNNAYYSLSQRKKEAGDSFVPTITITTKLNGKQFEIHFRDNGKGIPAAIVPKIFSPFFTTKPTGEGAGLGLSLSHNIVVEEHNGTLTFESQEGEYAEFVISLPKDRTNNEDKIK